MFEEENKIIEENSEPSNVNEAETAEVKAEKNDSKSLSLAFDVVSILASSVVAVCLFFFFVFRTVGVVGSSMYPTLHNGDRIILSAFYNEPKNGDVIVTCQPNSSAEVPDVLVKRIIATEGQTVDINFLTGSVFVDGEKLDEPYIAEPTRDREDFRGPVTVPEGYVFVMGDNRNNSTDSRDNRVGFIREEYIFGKAVFGTSSEGYYKIG